MSLLDDAKATPIGTLPTDIVGYAAWVTRFKFMAENRRIPISADEKIRSFLRVIFLFPIFHFLTALFLLANLRVHVRALNGHTRKCSRTNARIEKNIGKRIKITRKPRTTVSTQ